MPHPTANVNLSAFDKGKLIAMAKRRIAYSDESIVIVCECFTFLALWRLTDMRVLDHMSAAWAAGGIRGLQQVLDSL